jgi:hypothetical protein
MRRYCGHQVYSYCCQCPQCVLGALMRRYCGHQVYSYCCPPPAAGPSACVLVFGSADTATPVCTCRCLLLPPTPRLSVSWCLEAQTLRHQNARAAVCCCPLPLSVCFLVFGSADSATPECTCRCLLLPPTPRLSVSWCLEAQTLRHQYAHAAVCCCPYPSLCVSWCLLPPLPSHLTSPRPTL